MSQCVKKDCCQHWDCCSCPEKVYLIPCKTKLILVNYGFTLNQHNNGNSRAKIHFVDESGKAYCNSSMKMQPEPYTGHLMDLMYGKTFPCEVCLKCLKKVIDANKNSRKSD